MNREILMLRLEKAQAKMGNNDHNIKAGADLLSLPELLARVEEAEAVASRKQQDTEQREKPGG